MGQTGPVTIATPGSARGILTSVAPRRWAPAVFGVVPEGANRRRPSDYVRLGAAALIVTVTAVSAADVVRLEAITFDLAAHLPSWLRSSAEVCYRVGTVGTVVVVAFAFLFTRRFRLLALLVIAGGLGWLTSVALRTVVDASPARADAGLRLDGTTPEYPVVVLTVATTVLLVAAPYLLRPARRTVVTMLTLGALGALFAAVGVPEDVVGSVALAWGVAAALQLVVGTPAATPSLDQVHKALVELGVDVDDVGLAHRQVWGETRFVAVAPDGGPVSIDVIGRDATDARLFAKLWRAVWYKDSGATISLTRAQQLEHRAYVLLLAQRSGVPVREVVIAGIGGPNDIALLVMRDPVGVPLTEAAPERISDAVLDDAWCNIKRLHDERIAHGDLRAQNVLLRDDGTTAIVDFGRASSGAPPERSRLDAVQFLVTTAALVGEDRALAALDRCVGHAGLDDVLLMLEPAALSVATRHDLGNKPKPVLASLRDQGVAITGEPLAAPTELRRVRPADLLLAAGAILGVYLLIGELAGIDWSTTFDDAAWGWVVVAFMLSWTPPFVQAIAMLGSVGIALPYRAVVGEQIANNFTGLVGGTVATTALVIRFFQKQGQVLAVAASSGVLNSVAGFVVQTVLVVLGLVLTGSSFDLSDTGGRSVAGLVIVLLVVAAILVTIVLVVPRVRRRLRGMVAPQWNAAKENLRAILRTPRKAAMLFGGNLLAQLAFALILEASLHAYGDSLPVLQLIVINSLASLLGGMAPVPGGMGVLEAGLIGGLTAAGIPQTQAVAATFTHRLFTAYLPPIWGWFALQWLHRNDYV
jgi:uncharacterized membrane protein YbhN (UPF0104 family)